MDTPKWSYNRRKIDRNKAIVLMYANGYTLESIGNILGITRQRVQQITKKHGGDSNGSNTGDSTKAADNTG